MPTTSPGRLNAWNSADCLEHLEYIRTSTFLRFFQHLTVVRSWRNPDADVHEQHTAMVEARIDSYQPAEDATIL